jgi:hypothetical protein
MKTELKTMAEKQSLDPKEIMENGLTREQNDKIQKDGESVSAVLWIISMGLLIFSIMRMM